MATLYSIVRESDDGLFDGVGPEMQRDNNLRYVTSEDRFKDFEIVVKEYSQSTGYTDSEARRDYADILSYVKKEDILAFADSSRFSRNIGPSVYFLEKLRYEIGCKYIIVAERTFNLSNETDYTDLIKIQADEHRNSRTGFKKSKDGKKKWKDLGFYPGGPVAPGYALEKVMVGKSERKKYIIDQDKAERIYLHAKSLFWEGKRNDSIAVIFDEEEIQTSGRFKNSTSKWFKGKGTFWTGEVIRQMLRNPFYKGKIIDGKEVIPALISEEEYDLLLKEMKKRSKIGKVIQGDYLFRGFYNCNRCTSKLYPNYKRDKYICGCRNYDAVYRRQFKQCDLPPIPSKALDAALWNRVSMTLLSDTDLKKAILAKTEQLGIPELKEKIVTLQNGMNRLENAKKKLLQLAKSPSWSAEDIDEEGIGHDKEIAKVKSELALLKDKLNGELELGQLLNTIRSATNELRKNLYFYTDKQKRELLLKVVEKVTVDYSGEYYPRGSKRGKLDPDGVTMIIDLKINIKELCNLLKPLNQQPAQLTRDKAQVSSNDIP
jgi:hypothetical protein